MNEKRNCQTSKTMQKHAEYCRRLKQREEQLIKFSQNSVEKDKEKEKREDMCKKVLGFKIHVTKNSRRGNNKPIPSHHDRNFCISWIKKVFSNAERKLINYNTYKKVIYTDITLILI